MRRPLATFALLGMTHAPTDRPAPFAVSQTYAVETTPYGTLDTLASDGGAIASFSYPGTLRLVDFATGHRASVDMPAGTGLFGQVRLQRPPMAWAADGRSLWAVTGDIERPRGGWSLSSLRPVRISRAGGVTPLPALRSPAGPLDAILWAGGTGSALARFGTNGSSYRPEHADPAPEPAFVDAARGHVLGRLPLANLPAYRARREPRFDPSSAISWASAVRLPDGRLRALVKVAGALVRWTQGQAATELPDPAPEDGWTQGVLLPAGDGFLLTRTLQPAGVNIQYRAWSPNRPPPPTPTPRSGPLLERRDWTTGQLVWQATDTAPRFWAGDALSVSADGRYALASAPPTGPSQRLICVRTADGRTRQAFEAASDDAGFGGSAVMWIRTGGRVALYRRR